MKNHTFLSPPPRKSQCYKDCEDSTDEEEYSIGYNDNSKGSLGFNNSFDNHSFDGSIDMSIDSAFSMDSRSNSSTHRRTPRRAKRKQPQERGWDPSLPTSLTFSSPSACMESPSSSQASLPLPPRVSPQGGSRHGRRRQLKTTLHLPPKSDKPMSSLRFAMTLVCAVCMGLVFTLQSRLVNVVMVQQQDITTTDDSPMRIPQEGASQRSLSTTTDSNLRKASPAMKQPTMATAVAPKKPTINAPKKVDISNTAEASKTVPETAPAKSTTTQSPAATKTALHPLQVSPSQPQSQPAADATATAATPIIDVISIGSVTRQGLMEVQRRTWSSSKIRHFWAIHEDEEDTACYHDLTVEGVMNISNWCRDRYMHNRTWEYMQLKYNSSNLEEDVIRDLSKHMGTPLDISWVMSNWIKHYGHSKWLQKKSNPVGWLCAQKRFAKGLAAVLQQYRSTYTIPDFVLLVDDDTYVNVDKLIEKELRDRNSMQPYVGAGCRVRNEMDSSPITTFAFGGLGHVFSKGSIDRLMQPIYCGVDRQNTFENQVCKTVSLDLVGERKYFHEGMSIIELMDARVRAESYLKFMQWHEGFCFHADHYLAVMIHLYSVLSKEENGSELTIMDAMQESEMVIVSSDKTVRSNECWNEYEHCDETSMVCHYQSPQQMVVLNEAQQSKDKSPALLAPTIEKESRSLAMNAYDVHFTDRDRPSHTDMIDKMNASRRKCYEGVFVQLNEEWGAYVGGFTPNYSSACSIIQMFNIFERRFVNRREIPIPKDFAQTHQAVAYDDSSKYLYLLGGQLGGGCNTVSKKALRIQVETKQTQILPDLPEGRYAAGSAVIRSNSTTAHVHIFGGASPLRNMTARQHWMLDIADAENTSTEWQELEPVPDSNSHGVTFEHEGYIYHGSALNNDFGMQPTENIDICRAQNQFGVDSHHTTSMGAMWRYATEQSNASSSFQGHWERIQDMPIPAGQALVVKVHDSFLVVGGSNTHKEDGSTGTVIPNHWVRAYHPRRQEWDVLSPLAKPTKFGGMAWFDSQSQSVFVVRHNNNRPKRPLFNEGTLFNVTVGTVPQARSLQAKHLLDREYRRIGIGGFQKCLSERVNDGGFRNVTLFDDPESYDQARKTWNLRNNHLQVPNVITYPKTEQHVGAIVQCAKRNGYKVCGRNGKHSFEGDTCSFGVVVDTSHLNSIELVDHAKGQVRLGAGLTLGKVAVEVEEGFDLVFPMGHCATVGLTGLMLVGGQGVLSRQFGMTIDYVSSIQLVSESGSLIRATKDNEYSDYLWLARGGGSAVQHFPGIITSIEFSGLPHPEKPTVNTTAVALTGTDETSSKKVKVYTSFNIEYQPTVENAARLLTAWQAFYEDPTHIKDPLFSRLTVEPWLRMKPKSSDSGIKTEDYVRQLYLACYFYGNDEQHQQFMDMYYSKLVDLLPASKWSNDESNGGYVKVSKIVRLTNFGFHKRLSGVRSKTQLASGQDGWDLDKRWKGYSAVSTDSAVSVDAFRVLAQSMFESEPFTERYVEIKPLGAAVSKVSKDATAFGHREAHWWLLSSHFMLASDFEKSSAIAPFSDEAQEEVPSRAAEILRNSRAHHDRFLDSMQDSFGGFYAGYIDHGRSTGRDLELYYGKSHAKKIADIKLQRDPHNVFHLYLPNAMDESSSFQQQR